jgi:hypothetical protein
MDTVIPGHFGEQETHPTEIRDARKDQSRSDKSGQTKEEAIHQPAQDHPQQNQRAGGDANLPLQAHHADRPADDGQARVNPSLRSTGNHNAAIVSLNREFFRRFASASARPTEEIDWLTRRQNVGFDDSLRLELIQWFVARLRNVDFRIFDRGPHIQQQQLRLGLQEPLEFNRRDCFHKVEFL